MFATHPVYEAAIAPAVRERVEGRGQAGARRTRCVFSDLSADHKVAAESESYVFFSRTLHYRWDTY